MRDSLGSGGDSHAGTEWKVTTLGWRLQTYCNILLAASLVSQQPGHIHRLGLKRLLGNDFPCWTVRGSFGAVRRPLGRLPPSPCAHVIGSTLQHSKRGSDDSHAIMSS